MQPSNSSCDSGRAAVGARLDDERVDAMAHRAVRREAVAALHLESKRIIHGRDIARTPAFSKNASSSAAKAYVVVGDKNARRLHGCELLDSLLNYAEHVCTSFQ